MLTLEVSFLVEKLPERFLQFCLDVASVETPCDTPLFLVIKGKTERIAEGCEGPFRSVGLGFFYGALVGLAGGFGKTVSRA